MSTLDIRLPRQSTINILEIPRETPLERLTVQEIHAYFQALRKTVWTAMATMLASIVVGVPALCALIEFLRSGGSFMHPYLAMFLVLGSIGLFSTSVLSGFKTKSQLQFAVGRLLRSCSEML